jgi:general secretion pathway protein D
MSVTPFIDQHETVTLNVRPTISRIIGFVADPNPQLADAGVTSEIPVIQVREIESVLKIENGDTAVIGGLMQDQIDKTTSGIPILSSIPWLGALFRYQDDKYEKSELVIFIRPVVTKDASLTGDFKEYRKYLLEELHTQNDKKLKTAEAGDDQSQESTQ